MNINDALKALAARGEKTVTASQVAAVMWPDCRHSNSNGQVFHLGSGVAGRMLRRTRAAFEVRPRVWEIVPEFLERRTTKERGE